MMALCDVAWEGGIRPSGNVAVFVEGVTLCPSRLQYFWLLWLSCVWGGGGGGGDKCIIQ